LQSLAAEAVTFGLTAAGSVGAGNIDVVCHTGIRLVVRTLFYAAGYRRFGVAIAFCIFHDFYPPFLISIQLSGTILVWISFFRFMLVIKWKVDAKAQIL
jgi:hypothetical protein